MMHLATERPHPASPHVEENLLVAQSPGRAALYDLDSGLNDSLAVVAHDLKNPLTAILLRCERMRRHLSRGAAEPARLADDFARDIERYAGRMQALIQTVLEAAKMGGDPFRIERRCTGVTDLIDEMRRMVEPQAQAQGVRLSWQVAANLGQVRGDADRLSQVFGNLVDNALRLSRAGQQVVVAISGHLDHVQFSITDEGPGIQAEHLPHLFERLWQGPQAAHRGSSGLGLYIARRIVDAHGGAIGVATRTEAPSGTTFSFNLPRDLHAAPGDEARLR